MPTANMVEEHIKSDQLVQWWGYKLLSEYDNLSYRLNQQFMVGRPKSEQDPYAEQAPDQPPNPPYTKEEGALIERINDIEIRKEEIRGFFDNDPLNKRIILRDAFMSTNPLIQRMRQDNIIENGIRAEQAFSDLQHDEIVKLEDAVDSGDAKLPKSLGPIESLRHLLEELTGKDYGIRGKDGEKYPEEYMREKQDIYEDATRENNGYAKKYKAELLTVMKEAKILAENPKGTPSDDLVLRAEETSKNAIKTLQDQFNETYKTGRDERKKQREKNKDLPPFDIFEMPPAPDDTAKFNGQNISSEIALSSSPSFPAGSPPIAGNMHRGTVGRA